MVDRRRSATWLGAALGSFCALLTLAISAHGSDHRGALSEEFHQTYPITARNFRSISVAMHSLGGADC